MAYSGEKQNDYTLFGMFRMVLKAKVYKGTLFKLYKDALYNFAV